MWKIWLALAIAGVVAVITVIMGVIHQTRFAVILYRAIISIIIIGGGAYIASFVYEKYLLPYWLRQSNSRENLLNNLQHADSGGTSSDDELRADEQKSDEQILDEKTGEIEFSPLTADNLNRVSPPNS